jgi:broad specificity phosphatase PhoE
MNIEEIVDPLTDDVYIVHNGREQKTSVESDRIDFQPRRQIMIIMIRHGETFKNDAKNLAKTESSSSLEQTISSEIESEEIIESLDRSDILSVPNSPHLMDKDSKINIRGKDQALKVAKYLKNRPISRIISSNVTRAIQTARIITNETGVECEIDVDLPSMINR